MFENVGDPLGVLLIRFLSPNCLNVFGVGQDDCAGSFQNVVNRYPIFPGQFHAYILTMVLCQPVSTPAQIIVKGRKPFTLINCNTLLICRGDTRYDKARVNIHPIADRETILSITHPLGNDI